MKTLKRSGLTCLTDKLIKNNINYYSKHNQHDLILHNFYILRYKYFDSNSSFRIGSGLEVEL